MAEDSLEAGMGTFQRTLMVHAVRVKRQTRFLTPGRQEMVAEEGQWIVLHEGGFKLIMSDAQFRAHGYHPVDGLAETMFNGPPGSGLDAD